MIKQNRTHRTDKLKTRPATSQYAHVYKEKNNVLDSSPENSVSIWRVQMQKPLNAIWNFLL